jgi:hypothetical protein
MVQIQAARKSTQTYTWLDGLLEHSTRLVVGPMDPNKADTYWSQIKSTFDEMTWIPGNSELLYALPNPHTPSVPTHHVGYCSTCTWILFIPYRDNWNPWKFETTMLFNYSKDPINSRSLSIRKIFFFKTFTLTYYWPDLSIGERITGQAPMCQCRFASSRRM